MLFLLETSDLNMTLTSVRPPKPAFGTFGFIFCMKTVDKLIKGFLVVRKVLLWVYISS